MSISIDTSPVGTMGGLALYAGQGQYAQKQQARNDQIAQQIAQQQMQAAEMQQRAQQADQDRMFRANQAWQDRQAHAFQQAQQNAAQYNQQQMLADRQRASQGAIDDRLDQRQNWQWQEQGADALENQIKLQQASMAKMAPKMAPEGMQKYKELSGKLRAIQAHRATTPPELYANELAKWQDEFDRSGVSEMITETPALDADWAAKNYFGPMVKDENGRMVPKDVSFYTQPDGKVTHIVAKPDKEKIAPPDLSTPEAQGKYIKSRIIKDENGREWIHNPRTDALTPAPASKETDPELEMIQESDAKQKIANELDLTQPYKNDSEGNPTKIREPVTAKQIDDEYQKRLERIRGKKAAASIPESDDVEFLRKTFAESPQASARFEALTREEREAEAEKARKALTKQFTEKLRAMRDDQSTQLIQQQVGPAQEQVQLGQQPAGPLASEYAAKFGAPPDSEPAIQELDRTQHNRLAVIQAAGNAELAKHELILKYGPDGPPAGVPDRMLWDKATRVIEQAKGLQKPEPPARVAPVAAPPKSDKDQYGIPKAYQATTGLTF